MPGILTLASATVLNIGARVWVMDPAVNDVVTGEVRCVEGHRVPSYAAMITFGNLFIAWGW